MYRTFYDALNAIKLNDNFRAIIESFELSSSVLTPFPESLDADVTLYFILHLGQNLGPKFCFEISHLPARPPVPTPSISLPFENGTYVSQ